MVVVLAKVVEDDLTRLIVAPITHSEPPAGGGVEIPSAVKRHLGLDDERSWIVTTEVNQFIWPGPDIRPAKGLDTPLHGAIPAKLFSQLTHQISENAQAGEAVITKRAE